MSRTTIWWIVVALLALGAILLFNYWASFQPLSTVAYFGIVLTVGGAANAILPFRFLGIQKRWVGPAIFGVGILLTTAALFYPAPTIRITDQRSLLDRAMPEYQFEERHSTRVQAAPEQVMAAVRQSTFGDLKSLSALMKVRAMALRINGNGEAMRDLRIVDAFSKSGYVLEANNHELVMCGGANAREKRPLQVLTLQECAAYDRPGAVKVAFNFRAEDARNGWSTVTTETRVVATDDSTRKGMARYWRLIVPGSGLLRREWLDVVRKRAEVTNH